MTITRVVCARECGNVTPPGETGRWRYVKTLDHGPAFDDWHGHVYLLEVRPETEQEKREQDELDAIWERSQGKYEQIMGGFR